MHFENHLEATNRRSGHQKMEDTSFYRTSQTHKVSLTFGTNWSRWPFRPSLSRPSRLSRRSSSSWESFLPRGTRRSWSAMGCFYMCRLYLSQEIG